jgi:hypothetical protein
MGKVVCFSEKVHVIKMKVWSFAYRESRNGYCWLSMGIDAERFRRRIYNIGCILEKVFESDFRERVYEERFKKINVSSRWVT